MEHESDGVIHLFDCPEYINFLKPILFMARDSSNGFQQGYHTFLHGHKKYNRRSGKKRTNEQYGLRSAPSAQRVVLWLFCTAFRAICRLSQGVYFSWNFFKATRNANSSWLVFLHCFLLLSVVDSGLLTHLDWSFQLRSRLLLCVSLRQLTLSGLLFQLPLWLLLDLPFLPHFRSRRRSLVLCLVSQQNRQRDRLLSGPLT